MPACWEIETAHPTLTSCTFALAHGMAVIIHAATVTLQPHEWTIRRKQVTATAADLVIEMPGMINHFGGRCLPETINPN